MNRAQRSLLTLAVLLLAACDTSEKPPAVRVQVPVLASEASKPAPKPAAKPIITPAAPAAKVTQVSQLRVTKVVEPVSLSLDLSLPETAIATTGQAHPSSALLEAPSRLPPLFIDESTQPSRFQLNGRLVTDQTIDEVSIDAVSGVELQIEFKQ